MNWNRNPYRTAARACAAPRSRTAGGRRSAALAVFAGASVSDATTDLIDAVRFRLAPDHHSAISSDDYRAARSLRPVRATTGRGGAHARALARPAFGSAFPYGLNDDQRTLALLTVPILAITIAFGMTEAWKPGRWAGDVLLPPIVTQPTARPPPQVASLPLDTLTSVAPRVVPPLAPPATTPAAVPAEIAHVATLATVAVLTAPQPVAALSPTTMTPSPAAPTVAAVSLSRSATRLAALEPTAAEALPPPARIAGDVPTAPVEPAAPRYDMAALAPGLPPLARVLPPPAADAAREIDMQIALPAEAAGRVCVAPPDLLLATHERVEPPPKPSIPSADDIGAAIAAAARRQLDDLVIYDDRYRRLAYPMGDVNPLYGVCTDVVIRAFRAVGIDLQQLVQEARVGRGDPNIDHRRTETLRRFFARFGESLPVTTIAEDYRPGDVVTYHRPQNTSARSHIALVSDVLAPSGRYMILHNRGWGPELEDGLFVDEITGHYRYAGPPANRSTPPPVPRSILSRVGSGIVPSIVGARISGLGR